MKDNGEPRAGYYIYKIPNIKEDKNIDDVGSLIISASFGYKRALYKYGHRLVTGRDTRISMDEQKGENLIKQAAYQNHKKAIRYCKSHNISYIKKDNNSKLSDKTNRKNSRNKSIDEDDSLSDIHNANTNEKELNNSENDIIRPEKGSIPVNDEDDEINSDSYSYDISGLQFWS